MSHILRHDWIKGGGNISKICLDIDEGLLEELRMQAIEIESDCRDLIVEYIEKGLNGCDNMQSICISDEIMNGITDRSKEINCNPEKLVNSILYDYLRKVKDLPPTIDAEKIWAMLDHDGHEGDDVLEKLFNLGETGWD